MVERLFQHLTIGIMMLSLVGCNFQASQEGTSTRSPATIAALTLEVVFTRVASQTEQVGAATQAPGTNPEATKSPSPTPGEACINRAFFVDDITIRDNTQIVAGTTFTKIWRLRNDGTCTWNQSYKLTFFGGERMGAPNTISLTGIVHPGQTIDIALDLTAPEEPGVYQGFWRLQSAEGDYFGIGPNGDQSFWVKIIVIPSQDASPTSELTPTYYPSDTPSPSATLTPSATPTPSVTPPPTETPIPSETPSPTATPTPAPIVYRRGDVKLFPGQDVNLDTGKVSPAAGEDLSLNEIANSEYSLNPRNNALLALYPDAQKGPSKSDCESIPKSSQSIPLYELAVNDNLCYSTDEGRPGYLTVTALNGSIDFSFTTWVP
jgi:hypothetical protein